MMSLPTSTAWTLAVLLLSLRLGPLFVLAPPFSQMNVPMRVRVCLTLALSACLVDTASGNDLSKAGNGTLVLAAVTELFMGLALAFAFQAAFASLSFAGRVLDVQAGYGLAMVLDPGSRQQAPLFGTIFTVAAGAIFFAVNGHLDLLRLVASLAHLMPAGHANLIGDPLAFITYFGAVMTAGLAASAAGILCLFLIDVAIAFLSRTLPQMNALMLGLQVKTVATLVVSSMSVGLLAPVVLRLIRLALAFVPALD
jgi:flagellar biosynthesis protein FliR